MTPPDSFITRIAAEDVMDQADRLEDLRLAAGWIHSEDAWSAPDGTLESEWSADDLPLPAQPGCPAFISAYFHYNAADADALPELEAQVSTLQSLHHQWPSQPNTLPPRRTACAGTPCSWSAAPSAANFCDSGSS